MGFAEEIAGIESCCESSTRLDKAGTLLRVRVKPRSSQTGPIDVFEDSPPALRWGVHSSPTDGEANEELRASIARRMKCALSRVTIVKGHLTRVKSVFISGKSVSEVLESIN